MVSIGPYSEAMNFTHMFDIPDLRGNLPKKVETPGSLSYLLTINPDFSKFRYMLRLAKLDNIYNDCQADFTIFVPSDKAIQDIPDEIFTNMDSSTARTIIKSSTLNRKITSDILEDTRGTYIITQSTPNRLLITNNNGNTYIDKTIKIIKKDIIATNGIIHVVDKLIKPLII